MKMFYADGMVELHHADCLDVLRAMADASVDSVVTDPPYGLEFMGKEWDSFKPGGKRPTIGDADGSPHRRNTGTPSWAASGNPVCRNCGGTKYDRTRPNGCRCDAPDFPNEGAAHMRAYQSWCEAWVRECLRILKPGGHLVAFGGTRTVHRLACAVEDAGFEIRDGIDWIYGSGFPKSLDVSKAIDKAGGASPEVQARVFREARIRMGLTREEVADAVGCTPSSVRDWEEGRARATGRAVEYIVPSPDYRERVADLLGYTADERRVVGATSDRRGDGTVIGLGHSGVRYGGAATVEAERWRGWGTALKPAREPIVVGRKPLAGTVAANVLAHGTGALNIDSCRAGNEQRTNSVGGASSLQRVSRVEQGYRSAVTTSVGEASTVIGRWPSNVVLSHTPDCGDMCLPGCPVAELDQQSGISASRIASPRAGQQGSGWRMKATGAEYDDRGGASRFFPVFRYEAKAPSAERPRAADGTAHATVKPLALMRWLVRLVTPPGGVVLEPFAGSGTTAEACVLESFRCIAIERDASYLPLIHARLSKPLQPALDIFGGAA